MMFTIWLCKKDASSGQFGPARSVRVNADNQHDAEAKALRSNQGWLIALAPEAYKPARPRRHAIRETREARNARIIDAGYDRLRARGGSL